MNYTSKYCLCSILHDTFVEQSNCVANERFAEIDSVIGGSFSLYFGLGAEASISFDPSAFANELIDIFYEPYVGYY